MKNLICLLELIFIAFFKRHVLFNLFFILCFVQTIYAGKSSSTLSPPQFFPQWNALGDGLNGTVKEIVIHGEEIFVGGQFTNAGGDPDADYLARWDGNAWKAVASGLNKEVEAIVINGNDIYIGGAFTNAGGNPDADYIARWDGSTWHALSSGLNANVFAIAIRGSEVFVGGQFTDAGGDPNGDHIARWNGDNWHALGTGITSSNNWVWSISLNEQDLYAGGNFLSAGGVQHTRGVARWDGSDWHALGSGFSGDMGVIAIGIDGEDIYVGGDGGSFDTASCGIARWDGSTWHALDHGLSNCLYGEGAWAIETVNGNTYVGGSFNNAGGINNTSCIAQWDGDNWHALGVPQLNPLVSHVVLTIANHEADVYVGGFFPGIGGIEGTHNIARWGEPPTTSSNEVNKSAHQDALRVFPNPSRDVISYNYGTNTFQMHNLMLTDMGGTVLMNVETQEQELNISQLSAGIYFLKVETEEFSGVAKVIKY